MSKIFYKIGNATLYANDFAEDIMKSDNGEIVRAQFNKETSVRVIAGGEFFK